MGATNHALLVNDYRAGIGKREVFSPWNSIQLVSELQISCFELMGKYEYEAKVGLLLASHGPSIH
jgi:hypothetical protein